MFPRGKRIIAQALILFSIVAPVILLIIFTYLNSQAIVRLEFLILALNSLLGYLIINFIARLDKSSAELREASIKLREANIVLEERVRERTGELRRINQVVEEEKVRNEAILLAIGDGLVVTDRDGKITFVNKAFEKLLGWDADEIFGKKMTEVIQRQDEKGNMVLPEERMSHVVLSTQKTITTATSYFIRKDKSRLPIAVTAAPIILDNIALGAVEVFRDISKEMEVDRVKTEFVSLASHQLRTPLSTVKWHIELLLGGDLGKVSERQRKYLRDISRANERMVGLVNALLNVSRIEMGTMAVNPEPTNILEVAESVLGDFAPQIKEKKLAVSQNFDSKIPVVQADQRILTIIFQNLISNAIQYTPLNGKIDLSLTRDGGDLLFTIADTGYGIPESQKSRVFTKLFRGDNVKARETGGNGLGLYVVKYVVERVGGKIWFESKENKGSTFYVQIPFSEVKQNKE